MIRYNVSFVDKDGYRKMFGPNQGRCLHDTSEEAEAFLKSMYETNGEDRLVQICGEQARGTFRVDPFDCYDHGDAKGIHVADDSV